MSGAISNGITMLRSHLKDKRFEDATLRILEAILVSKDVRSLLDTRSALQELLRSEAVSVLREIAGKNVDQKLSVAEFFVRAFALVRDVESCLSLKYEALVLRELKYISNPSLQVSYEEWLTFAEDSLGYGFYSIAIKGFDNALLCIQYMREDSKLEFSFREVEVKKIKQQRDIALALVSSHSVRTRTSEYLKEKSIELERKQDGCSIGKKYLASSASSASSMYRDAIKKRNMKKLHKSRALQQGICQPYATSFPNKI